VVSALVVIVASQALLAAMLFGTAAIDRPDFSPLAPVRRLARRFRGPLHTMQVHQRRIASLGAAAARSATADR
jgi:hypothetical protein